MRIKIEQALKAHAGLILVTGPIGCGKTAALYACVKRLASSKIKIITIEDPIEYLLPGVAQVQVMPSTGLTFLSALRASMRAAPNVLLLGEIRDHDTAMLAHNCALTGQLILTSLHTQNAVGALRRMLDIGIPALLVGDATRLVVAQRLFRKLCPQCSKAEMPSRQMLEWAEQILHQSGINWTALPKHFREPVGCAVCNQTGYRGRAVMAEALEMTPELACAMARNASVDELTTLAVKQGMVPLVVDGIQHAANGETSLVEVFRAAPH